MIIIRERAELGIDKRNIVFYALCILYTLCTVLFIVDNTAYAAEVSLHS